MFLSRDRRIARVEKALKELEESLVELHDTMMTLRKRLMSLEGRTSRNLATSNTERKLLEDLLGGKVVAIGDDSPGDGVLETKTG